ncbi:DNA repair protein [Legionella nautarum]|uniref:DNA repair protein n=1 Tax=Legionella nautarum TaxID=45070 RepID=A0A0W0WKL6_9GAMM|nr:hypothetical protein [Legionella nautarum]KTD32880.1 DNA repair protein [Legionella nautarum]
MWYYKLLCALLFKVEKKERLAANSFLITILSEVDDIFEASRTEPVPPQVYLALVDKMYKKFKEVADGSVTLIEFARELFTLALILSKAADDEHIYLDNFENIIKDRNKLGALGIFTIEPMAMLNSLEKEQLMKMNYNVSPDLDHILRILHQQKDLNIHLGLINYYEPLASISDLFDDFINKVNVQYQIKSKAAIPAACPTENRKRKAFALENKPKQEREEPKEQLRKEVCLLKKPRLSIVGVNSQSTPIQYEQEPHKHYLSKAEFIQLSPFGFFASQFHGQNQISQVSFECLTRKC